MALRIGLIGAGANTASQHIPGFRRCPGVEVTGVANRTEASSRRIADQFGIATVFSSPEALCASPDIDAVCIGTWPYKHREFTIMALEAGKHVLCEARMATDLEAAEDMLAASERNPGLVSQLVPAPFDFRLGPTITRLIAEGALGDVLEVAVTLLNGSSLDASVPLHWRQRADYSGKNVMMFGIFVEVIQRWLGDHRDVLASGDIVVPRRLDTETGAEAAVTVPDVYVVTGHLARGARITYHFSSVAAGGDASTITVFGSKATLRWRMGDTAVIQPHGGHPAEVTPDAGTDRGWKVEEDFVASIRDGAPVRLTSFADGVRYMRVIDAAHDSYTGGGVRTI
ncbi:MAG TPA: Gfo/Idh/MocA family oxidoreductase [Tepidiformaceae bacterium]|nr:Gfo/Idh/MocA family oxidoreductase [Tepidiformaceae bacterium]